MGAEMQWVQPVKSNLVEGKEILGNSTQKRRLRRLARDLAIENDIVVRRRGVYQQIVVPPSLRVEVIANVHQQLAHPSTGRTYARLLRFAYWKGLHRDVRDFVASCEDCQRAGRRKTTRINDIDIVDVTGMKVNEQLSWKPYETRLKATRTCFCTHPLATITLNTGDAKPVFKKQYPLPMAMESKVMDQVRTRDHESSPHGLPLNNPLCVSPKKDAAGNKTSTRAPSMHCSLPDNHGFEMVIPPMQGCRS